LNLGRCYDKLGRWKAQPLQTADARISGAEERGGGKKASTRLDGTRTKKREWPLAADGVLAAEEGKRQRTTAENVALQVTPGWRTRLFAEWKKRQVGIRNGRRRDAIRETGSRRLVSSGHHPYPGDGRPDSYQQVPLHADVRQPLKIIHSRWDSCERSPRCGKIDVIFAIVADGKTESQHQYRAWRRNRGLSFISVPMASSEASSPSPWGAQPKAGGSFRPGWSVPCLIGGRAGWIDSGIT